MSACHECGSARIRWTPRPDGLEESVQFQPGYNCPVEGWNGRGVHGSRDGLAASRDQYRADRGAELAGENRARPDGLTFGSDRPRAGRVRINPKASVAPARHHGALILNLTLRVRYR